MTSSSPVLSGCCLGPWVPSISVDSIGCAVIPTKVETPRPSADEQAVSATGIGRVLHADGGHNRVRVRGVCPAYGRPGGQPAAAGDAGRQCCAGVGLLSGPTTSSLETESHCLCCLHSGRQVGTGAPFPAPLLIHCFCLRVSLHRKVMMTQQENRMWSPAKCLSLAAFQRQGPPIFSFVAPESEADSRLEHSSK